MALLPDAKRLTSSEVSRLLAMRPALDEECFRARGGGEREPVFALEGGVVLVVEPGRGGYVVGRDQFLAYYRLSSPADETHPYSRWSQAGSGFLAAVPRTATTVLAREVGASCLDVSAQGLAALDASLRTLREELWAKDRAVFDAVVGYCGECVRRRVRGARWGLASSALGAHPVVRAHGAEFDPAAEVAEVLAHPRTRSLVGAVEYAVRSMGSRLPHVPRQRRRRA